jgi:hypothetical protein
MSYIFIDEQKLEDVFNEFRSFRAELKEQKVKSSKKLTENWLDNQDVMELLKVSPRTLQNMRDSQTLPYSKVGGKIYYKATDVENLLNSNYHE